METIRIIGVPEHFNYPWLNVIAKQPFQSESIHLQWIDEPKGSGAMNKAIRNGEADMGIILTESFIKDKIDGNTAKIIGFHVQSPLVWGIHVSAKSTAGEIADLNEVPFLISRYGSGSHLMAYLLAKREGWDTGKLKFEVIEHLEGAKREFETGDTKVFLWEKYTTKPLVDQGLFKRVGEIPTPWPCFVTVATPGILKKYPSTVTRLRDLVFSESEVLKADPTTIAKLSQAYKISENDLEAWLGQTSWAVTNQVSKNVLDDTMATLLELELIQKSIPVQELVATAVVDLV